MALIQCHFFSDVLQLSTSMTVILPQQTRHQIGMQNNTFADKHPTLYLLHGLSDDDSIWLRRTSIERYVASTGLAVVMPQVHRSFYTDMAYGNRYWTFISEELPNIARSFFPLSAEREDNFVAGLSMGGYGAFKWALSKPDRFAAAASLSGAMFGLKYPDDPESQPDYKLIYGDNRDKNKKEDLHWLLEQCAKADGPKPMLYQCCGTEDFLYDYNVQFRELCEQTNLDYTYEEGPGSHEWGYWDAKIQDVLAWLPLKNKL